MVTVSLKESQKIPEIEIDQFNTCGERWLIGQ